MIYLKILSSVLIQKNVLSSKWGQNPRSIFERYLKCFLFLSFVQPFLYPYVLG